MTRKPTDLAQKLERLRLVKVKHAIGRAVKLVDVEKYPRIVVELYNASAAVSNHISLIQQNQTGETP
jgi:hypothetical protein